MVRYLRNPRLWDGVPAVVVGVVVGLLTNIVTTTPTWPVVGGLVATVGVWAALTVRQAVRAEKDRLAALREARDELLEPMQRACRDPTRSERCWRPSTLWRRSWRVEPRPEN